MGEVPTQVEPAVGAPTATGSDRPTLQRLADTVEMTDVASAESAGIAVADGAGRLREFAQWCCGTQGRWPALAPARPRLVVRGPVGSVGPAVAAIAGSIRVGIDEFPVPADGDVQAAFAAGVAAADAQAERGTDLVVLADAAVSAAPAVLVSIVSDTEPVALLPRGPHAIDTAAWIERAVRARDLRRAVRTRRHDPADLLTALADPRFAGTCGFVMDSAARRAAVLLDGAGAVAAGVLCVRTRERVGRWLRVTDTSTDPVHARGVAYLDRRPLLDLDTEGGTGLAGLLAITLLRASVELGRHRPAESQTEDHE